MVKQLQIPINVWVEFSCRVAASHLAGQSGSQIVSVPAIEYQGYLYLVTSALYTVAGDDRWPVVSTYRLVPIEFYQGDTTTIWHDEPAISRGERARGDHKGLIVSVKGTRMVCAEAVQFRAGLPNCRVMSRHEAQAHDASNRNLGWRVFVTQRVEPDWTTLCGHPVAVYYRPDGDDPYCVLYWKNNCRVMEMTIKHSLLEADHSALALFEASSTQDQEQMALF